MKEAWVDINEAAKMLGVSHTTARSLRDQGRLVGKKMPMKGRREKWFITKQSIQDYLGRGPVQSHHQLKRKLREAEKRRDEVTARLTQTTADYESLRRIRDRQWAEKQQLKGELKKLQKHRDQLQECLNNQPDLSPYIAEALEKLHKRLDSPEVRLLQGRGPSYQQVFELVLAAGVLDVQKQLAEPTSTKPKPQSPPQPE